MATYEIAGAGTLITASAGRDSERRTVFAWSVVDTDGTIVGQGALGSGDEMRSGIDQDPSEDEMISTLASFLGAAAESYGHAMRNRTPLEDTENGTLFGPEVTEWAYLNSDELAMVGADDQED